MAETASLNIRLDDNTMKAAESVYSRYGLTLAETVAMFIHQSCDIGEMPFGLQPVRPNAETREAMREAERISRDPSVKGYRNMDELFRELEADV
jgi:DNA-damage-inducible protein J